MRLLGVIVLAIVAMLAGLFGVMMLGLSGLTLAGPGLMIIEYSDSDDVERTIGIVMGLVSLAGWLVLLLAAAFVGLRGERNTRARRAALWTSAGLSTVLVLAGLTFVLSTAPRSLV